MARSIHHRIGESQQGRTVLSLLRQELGFSSAMVKAMKLGGGIALDGQPVYTNQRAQAGQLLCCTLPQDPPEHGVQPVPGPLCIRFEDEDLLVVEKPAGVAVHPSQGHFTDSLANYFAHAMNARGTPLVFRAVNRLDRGTSGLLVLAKHAHAQALLIGQLHSGSFQRRYLALVCGAPRPEAGTISAPILDVPGQLLRRVSPAGAPAVTHYETLAQGGPYCLVGLGLQTGRTHQIRVHMSHLGHPLAGDFLYGTEIPGFLGHALHSCRVALHQPITGAHILVESPLPPAMAQLLAQK